MTFGGKKSEIAALTHDIEVAEASKRESELLRQELDERRPLVESVVDFLRNRKIQNGLGEDFEISLIPRRIAP